MSERLPRVEKTPKEGDLRIIEINRKIEIQPTKKIEIKVKIKITLTEEGFTEVKIEEIRLKTREKNETGIRETTLIIKNGSIIKIPQRFEDEKNNRLVEKAVAEVFKNLPLLAIDDVLEEIEKRLLGKQTPQVVEIDLETLLAEVREMLKNEEIIKRIEEGSTFIQPKIREIIKAFSGEPEKLESVIKEATEEEQKRLKEIQKFLNNLMGKKSVEDITQSLNIKIEEIIEKSGREIMGLLIRSIREYLIEKGLLPIKQNVYPLVEALIGAVADLLTSRIIQSTQSAPKYFGSPIGKIARIRRKERTQNRPPNQEEGQQ